MLNVLGGGVSLCFAVAKCKAKITPHLLSEALPERTWITLKRVKFANILTNAADLNTDLLYSDEFIGPMKITLKIRKLSQTS